LFFFFFIFICIFSIRGGKPQSTITDGMGYEGQSLTENNEDSTLKEQIHRINQIDDNQL
jgi:hypothetical protein